MAQKRAVEAEGSTARKSGLSNMLTTSLPRHAWRFAYARGKEGHTHHTHKPTSV